MYYFNLCYIRFFTKLLFHIKTSGQKNFPKKGGFILACNHISFFDPPFVGSWANRQVYFLAKKELFDSWLFGAFLRSVNSLPLNRRGFDRSAIKMSLGVISKGYGLTIFPEGTRSKTDNFLPPKAGVGMIASQAKCPIVPAYVQGTDKLKGCLLGKAKMIITYGEPVSAEWIASLPPEKESYIKIAQEVMKRIGELKKQVNP